MSDSFGHIEGWIRQGKAGKARAAIRDLRLDRLSRAERVRVANLARRSGMPSLTIAILNPTVRRTEKTASGSERERLEYAVALSVLGAISEAAELIRGIDPARTPESLLYRCFALFPQWKYKEAIEPLKRFGAVSQDPYLKQVGAVNLAAALIFENRLDEATKTLEGAVEQAQKAEAWLLYSNCLELRAQIGITGGDFRQAAKDLGTAAQTLTKLESAEAFYVRKWQFVLELKKDGPGKKVVRDLKELREKALNSAHWETARDCDFHLTIALGDERLFTHLYHGTPFESYRERLIRTFERGFQLPPSYDWQLGEARSTRTLDLVTGREEGGRAALKPGQLLHRLLAALACDFYRPARPAALFATLFQGEWYNPQTSIPRVHQGFGRLRAWFLKAKVPLEVIEDARHYRLKASGPYALRTTLAGPGLGRDELNVQTLRAQLQEREFSARDAAAVLNVSRRSAIRALNWALANQSVETTGRGPHTRYRFGGRGKA